MKVPSVQQIREADQYTIAHEPIASIDLMERAAKAFVAKWIELGLKGNPVYVFCGTGNNGGDGLAISRLLNEKGYKCQIFTIGHLENSSQDFRVNLERIEDKKSLTHIDGKNDFPDLDKNGIIIDALFGSGLSRPINGLYGELIDLLNNNSVPIVSVDIASGLYAESTPEGAIIQPSVTISFQFPKLSFFQPSLSKYVGNWFVMDIGLSTAFSKSMETEHFYTLEDEIRLLLKRRSKFMHKGNAGKLLLVSGSEGMMGAAVLSAKAAFRSGVGLLVVHSPTCGRDVLQRTIPEAMVSSDKELKVISKIELPKNTSAVAIGPGIGTSRPTQEAIATFLRNWRGSLVIDADALNILAKNPEYLTLLPEETILTPHPKEFERMAGKWTNDFEKMNLLKNFCQQHSVNVVLKGAYSVVCDKKGNVHFNSTGNPGMATAGSGDVLTGIIGGLLAQDLDAFDALRLGVYLHGLAGDLAAQKIDQASLMSSDIIEMISDAHRKISGDFLVER